MPTRPATLLALAAGLLGTAPLAADEKLAGVACRSVHLGYPAADGVAFATDVTVETSAPGTYFMACGWDKGYFGIQELGNGKKVAIFSVWDSDKDDRDGTPAAERVKAVYKDPAVRVGRFGGEGSGGQSFFDLDWKAGATYRFLVTAVPEGKRTEYTGFLLDPAAGPWKRLVTFSVPDGGRRLKGYYSFVEDFKRDKVSATRARRAAFGNGWVRTAKGDWTPLVRARFTADVNPSTAIDAGTAAGRFTLATGGTTTSTGAKLNAELRLPRPDAPPAGLPDAPPAGGGK